jgi:hypothetical protein
MLNDLKSLPPRLSLLLLCGLLTFPVACNWGISERGAPHSPNAKRYALKGKVLSIDKRAGTANINNEPIAGFMDPMVMPYTIKPADALNRLLPGDTITADVVVDPDRYWLENVNVSAHSQPPGEKPASANTEKQGK